ncbi:MAG: efflux RND transporter periplasmic adaptor subunit [Opitutae bacterium]|nr:efflux RND transporter periplasmic adaptor subunit [Opitutae bacterium]
MKTFLPFLLLSFTLGLTLTAAGPAGHDHATVYQCPMHPWIKSDKPGAKCTICGMELVAAPAGDSGATADPNLVTLTPASATVVGVRTVEARRGALVRTLRVNGIVDDDDTRHRILTARVPGRVEKLFVNYVGAEVREGEPLATIYSPMMLTAQRQYVERLRAGNTAFTASDRAAARERLLELGLTEEEVNILEHTLEPVAIVNVRAPMSGTVVARHVYEGQELNKDESSAETQLFEIGDFSSMWFMFDAYEPDLAWLRTGLSVEVTVASQPGRIYTAPIAFIDPNLDPMTRTAKVRVVLPNRDRALLHKQTGLARVRLEVPDVLIVPRSAVLQHGAEPIVFVEQTDRAYLARRVRPGRVGDQTVEIVDGLKEGDRVVTEGGLILDGQAQLARAAITGELPEHNHGAPAPAPAPVAAVDHGYEQLKALAFTAADAAALLAADDFTGYQKHLPAFRAALQAYLASSEDATRGPLGKFKDGLPDRADLRSARRDFEPLSTALADLAREHHLHHREGFHVFECPMAPVLGTGRWLSRGDQTRNPFFGSAMLECGEELK